MRAVPRTAPSPSLGCDCLLQAGDPLRVLERLHGLGDPSHELPERGCFSRNQIAVGYGSLGTAVGMMMWIWISAIVILLGGELNAEIEHQTARDSTVGSEKPLGLRGAVMADTIGAARS